MTTPPTEPDKVVERVCQVCSRAQVTVDGKGTDQTCATCVGNTRQHIKALGIMSAALLGEALMMKISSNAADLAGPIADPETWGYRRMSALAARIDPKWLDDQVDMHHPAWVLGTWEREARLHLDQLRDAGARSTLTEARTYLDQHLTRLAQDAGFAFDELATDLRQCHDHVERVLHLDEARDRSRVTCTNDYCLRRPMLVRAYGDAEKDDHWACPACGTKYDDHDYRKAHATQLRHAGAARFLPQREAIATLVSQGRPERTIRKWLGPAGAETVGGYCDIQTHTVWVWWPDLWSLHIETPTRNRAAS